ncbi:MAG: rRNA pseudouridine synthase [Rickettsiales bacterium]|jgi:23S rRNA pseudouridine2605 synthase|nr:rRNA pseudouridine synthase [Rickettsiales bacterium]
MIGEKTEKNGERIAKVIANGGYCSRREAERLIEMGLVKVNGVTIDSPAVIITDQTIKIKNKLIPRDNKTKMWVFYKPRGFIVTNRDPQNRKTIYEILPPNLPRVITVGRLDMDTEGLLLLTNSGSVARYIEHPINGWTRRYRIKVHGILDRLRAAMGAMATGGIVIDGVRYLPLEISIEKESDTTNTWLLVSLKEGKNKEVRRIMEHFGLRVLRLVRISFGPFHIGAMTAREIRPVSRKALEGALGGRVKLD